MPVPSYVIAIIVIVVLLCSSSAVYLVLKKRKRGAVGNDQEQYLSEKGNTSSSYPVKPLVAYDSNSALDTNSDLRHENSSTSTIPPLTYDKSKSLYESRNKSTPTVDSSSSVWTTTDNTPIPAAPDVRIALPLPPPSSSFFSDKMELDSLEANELYRSYMNVAAQNQEYVSIDLDEKPFLSNAAANISSKAANLKSTLKQSMRRKSTQNTPKVTLNHFFDSASSTNSSVKSPRPESTRMSRQSSANSSRFPTRSSLQQPSVPSPRPDSPATEFFGKFSNNSSKKSLVLPEEGNSSNKLMLDSIPTDSYFALPLTTQAPAPLVKKTTIQEQQELAQQQQQELINQRQQAMAKKQQEDYSAMVNEINNDTLSAAEHSSDEEEVEPDNESESDNNASEEDAAVAARKLIRTASRKSRRSTLINEEVAQTMFNMINNSTPSPTEPPPAVKYGTLRKHSMQIDTSSLNREIDSVKKSANNSPSSPGPKRAIMSSTITGSATVSGKRMAKQQKLLAASFNNSSDNLYNNVSTQSVTLGRKSGANKDGPSSLRSLFSKPEDNKVAPIVITKEPLEEKKKTESIEPPSSPVIESPSSSKNNTLRKVGNVDTIRRMLQSSWSGNNLKESGSNSSLSSSDYMGSVGSSYKAVASPLGSVNPRLQNQHLVSLSLKANAVQQRSRPSMPIGFMNEMDGPIPTASFSSSTVRTMIPADEEEAESKPKSVIGNLLGSRQPRQPSKLGDNRPKKNGKKTAAQIEREKYLNSVKT